MVGSWLVKGGPGLHWVTLSKVSANVCVCSFVLGWYPTHVYCIFYTYLNTVFANKFHRKVNTAIIVKNGFLKHFVKKTYIK